MMKIKQHLHGYMLEYTCECGCDEFTQHDAHRNKDAVELNSMLNRAYFTCQNCNQRQPVWEPNIVKGVNDESLPK